jgi:GMP synthase (glutamine-hydrolysing)
MERVSPIPLTYHLPAIEGLDSLYAVESDVAGVVMFGSGASVHDRLAWQDALSAWLKPRADRGLPVLGLCYGHQLLAHLFGGEIDFLFEDHRKLRGYRDVTLVENRLWGAERSGPLVVSHREAVVGCPEGFDVVGCTQITQIEAIAHRELPLWGLQAHPEATAEFLTNNEMPIAPDAEAFAFGHAIVDAFLAFVSGRD